MRCHVPFVVHAAQRIHPGESSQVDVILEIKKMKLRNTFKTNEKWKNAKLQNYFIYMQKSKVLYHPLMLSHFSPAPRKNRSGNTNPINQSSQSYFFVNQSINQSIERFTMEVYAWLIDWFSPLLEKLPPGMISGWVQKMTQHNGTIQ